MASSQLLAIILLLCTSTAFAAVTIDSITPTTLSTTTSNSVQIVGSGFVSITGVEFSGINVTFNIVSPSLITVTVPVGGFGQDTRVEVKYNGGSVHADIVDYEAADEIVGCTELDVKIDYRIRETYFVTICGENFGSSDVSKHPKYQGKFEVYVGSGFKANVIEHEDDHIIVQLPRYGAGQNLAVRVYFGSQSVVVPDLRVSYPQPVVVSVKPATTSKRATAVPVIISGYNFGLPSPFIHVTVTIGGFHCVNLQHISDTEIRCSVTGQGSNVEVVVIINGLSSVIEGGVGAAAARFDFPNLVSPGLECLPPFGAADVINPERCNCWSGAAPSDNLLSTDCNVHAICAGRITSQADVGQHPPSRPETQFQDDKLWIKQSLPIVKNRRDTIVQFVVPNLGNDVEPQTAAGTLSSPTCFHPGTLWAKKVNNLDCLDEYYGVLPWSQHLLCGFVEHVDAATLASPERVYKSNLVTTFTETYKKADGQVYFRKVSHSFLISVSFVRQVVVLTHTPVTAYIADEKEPTSLEIFVKGSALYDVVSKKTLIAFTSTIAWPYKIDDLTLAGYWKKAIDNIDPNNHVNATAVLNPNQSGELECDQVQDTTCEQAWILTITTEPFPGVYDPVCNLKGKVEFNSAPLICRDYTTVGPCDGTPNTNFTISIGATELCDADAHTADASKGLTTKLESYYDGGYDVPQSVFQTGDVIYFRLSVVDPTSTIDQITFQEVEVSSSTDALVTPDQLYFITNSGADPSTADVFRADTYFNITQEFREPYLVPNSEGVLAFHFRLLRDKLNVIDTLSATSDDEITKQLTVTVTIDILYHGNQKRSFVATTNIPAKSHAQISFYNVDNADDDLVPHNNEDAVLGDDEISSLFASPASTIIASVVTVAGLIALVVA